MFVDKIMAIKKNDTETEVEKLARAREACEPALPREKAKPVSGPSALA